MYIKLYNNYLNKVRLYTCMTIEPIQLKPEFEMKVRTNGGNAVIGTIPKSTLELFDINMGDTIKVQIIDIRKSKIHGYLYIYDNLAHRQEGAIT
jgi:translation initiation factor IF-1